MRRLALLALSIPLAVTTGPSFAAPDDGTARAVREVATRVVVTGDRLMVSDDVFYSVAGTVGSPVRACASGRRLVLFEKDTRERLGSTTATRGGTWRFDFSRDQVEETERPFWQVRAPRKVVRVAGRRVVCRAGTMLFARTESKFMAGQSDGDPEVEASGKLNTYGVSRCLGARVVRLRNVTRGTDLGAVSTDADGTWAMSIPASDVDDEDLIKAKVVRKVVRGSGPTVTCGPNVKDTNDATLKPA